MEPSKPAKQSGGRWFRRFVGVSSSGSERAPAVPDVPDTVRVIGKQKSATNIRGGSTSSGFGGSGYGKVPPSPALSLDAALMPQSPVTLVRKVSPNRKAVPAWSPDVDPKPADTLQSPIALSAVSTPEPSQPKQLRPEPDVFTVPVPHPRSRQPDLAPSVSPASSKPSSMKRVPVPKFHPNPTDADIEVAVKVPEVKPGRRQDSRDPRLESRTEQDSRPHISVIPTAESKVQSIQTAAPSIGITPNQAAELRAALVHATTADECRVVLDAILGQWGLGRPAPEASAVPPLSAGCSEFDDSDEAMAVDMLLGEGTLRSENQWPLTPKDSHPKLYEARAVSVRSSE